MTLEPLLAAPLIVQAHAFSAMAAFVLGVIQFIAPKGTLPHRAIGVVWVLLMTTIAATSVFIRRDWSPGDPFWVGFSFIHIFTLITAYGVISGTLLLLRGGPALRHHAKPFAGVFFGGIIIAGAFAFLPGRIMYDVATGADTSGEVPVYGRETPPTQD